LRVAIFENLPLGGARRVSYELGRRLCERHEVDLYRIDVYHETGADLARHVRASHHFDYSPWLGLFDRRLKAGRFSPRSLTLFGPLMRLQRRIAAAIDARGYDVVLAQTDGMTQSPYLLRALRSTPSVFYCQEPFRQAQERALIEEQRRNLARSRFPIGALRILEDDVVRARLAKEDVRNVRAAGSIVANSRHTRARVWATYARDAIVCHPGVDSRVFSPGSAQSRSEVLSIGSPVEVKGHPTVIEALARIPTERRPRLRIVLPRPLGADALEALARELKVDMEVDFAIDEAGMVERYRQALAVVCAARLEPFGLTVLEAMACATPVIALREGGFEETVVEGQTGRLVEPGAEALAEALTQLLGDEEARERMGSAGRRSALQHWTWEQSAAGLESVLEASALAGRSAPASRR
jgi:glycosyltransferase involved in cell wall biosynthesis